MCLTKEEPPTSQRLRPYHKLRRSADYLRCYRRGRKLHGPLATLHYHPNEEQVPRLGITASRKIGKAVIRQRVKRRLREIYRCWEGRSTLPLVDIVVHLKPAAGRVGFGALKNEFEGLLSRISFASGRRIR